MFESLLDGFNTGVFVEQGHPQNASGVCIDQECQPQPSRFLPRFFVDNPGVYEPVISKNVVEGKLGAMDKGIKDEVVMFPYVFPKPLRDYMLTHIGLCFDVPRVP